MVGDPAGQHEEGAFCIGEYVRSLSRTMGLLASSNTDINSQHRAGQAREKEQ